ncbi:unnamed protein product [Pseudo-nitzschia multistriata]|uniref:Uncharacterized protein n=1 Tax=Pseudo-nitzschia multistriata TaxID=183589 RepID=A0A448ZHZ1_9STRA|nr:unnamed protein product [Pseudo-nitzschia multistriata]
MSRTMKPEELIRALAFVANPEELIKPDPSVVTPKIRDDSIGDGFRATVAKGLGKILSANALDLYGIEEHEEEDPGEAGEDPGEAGGDPLPETETTGAGGLASSMKLGSSQAPSSRRLKRQTSEVCFGTVEVRKYPITIGSNPSVSRGVPTTIEWDHLKGETETKHINAYERDRPNEERKRGDDLVLDSITRARMLKNLGYTKPELMEAMREVNESRRN